MLSERHRISVICILFLEFAPFAIDRAIMRRAPLDYGPHLGILNLTARPCLLCYKVSFKYAN